MHEATPDGVQPLQVLPNAPAAPLLAASSPQPGSAQLERQLSQQLLMIHASSLATAGLSGLGLAGSQDLGSLLDAGSLQGSPCIFDLDLLASPKWKALLNWEAAGSAAASPRHPDSAASSGGTPHATALPLWLANAGHAAAIASPRADQHAAASAAEAAWLEAAAQQAQQVLAALQEEPPELCADGQEFDTDMDAPEVEAAALSAAALMPAAGRRTAGVGKKRPSWAASSAQSQPATPTSAPPQSKQLRSCQGVVIAQAAGLAPRPPRPSPSGTSRFGLQAVAEQGQPCGEDALMMDAEAAAADAAASAAAFDAAAASALARGEGEGEAFEPAETAAEAALLSGLSRVRLSSIGGSLDQRRLTAAAAAAAVGPAGRLGVRLQRGDSGVQMLVPPGMLPGSPTWGACAARAELDKAGAAGKAHQGSPAVRVEVKVEAGDLPPLPPALGPLQQLPDLPLPPPELQAQAAAWMGSSAKAGEEAATAGAADAAAAWGAAWPAALPFTAGLQGKQRRQVLPTKSHKAVATGEGGVFTSAYRGVTRHRLTGRFEAHFWDSSYVRPATGKKSKRTRGRQVYVGGYETELEAARAYDRAVIAYLGTGAPLNFPPEDYADDLVWMAGRSPEEVVSILRRGSVGFARGKSQYRGVTRHHQHGKWESRIGRVDGGRYFYLGTYDTAEEAARAYDRACVKFRGARAILNFDLSEYQDILENPDAYDPAAAAAAATARAAGSSSAGAPAAARAARCPSVDMAAAAVAAAMGAQILAAAGGPLGLLPGAGMLLPLVAGTAPQMWGFALPPGSELAPPYQPAFPGAAAYQPSPLGLSHPCGPTLGSHQGLTSQGGYQPSPASTASHHPCLPATSSSEFGLLGMLNTAGGAAAEPGGPLLRLPAIRTRVAATAAGSVDAAAAVGGEVAPAGSPLTTRSADVDLAGFLLSPLGAALLSPHMLAGTPGSGWRDSPLSRFFAEGNGLQSPGPRQHRRADTGGSSATAAEAAHTGIAETGNSGACCTSCVAKGSGAGDAACPLGSPTSEADLASALKWLDSLDPAQLAAMLESPRAGSPASGGAAGTRGASTAPAGSVHEAGAA